MRNCTCTNSLPKWRSTRCVVNLRFVSSITLFIGLPATGLNGRPPTAGALAPSVEALRSLVPLEPDCSDRSEIG